MLKKIISGLVLITASNACIELPPGITYEHVIKHDPSLSNQLL